MRTVITNQNTLIGEDSNKQKLLGEELHEELENLRNGLNLDKLKITARLPEGYLEEVRQTNKLLKEAKTSFDNLAQEKRKKRIVLNLNWPAKICIAVIAAMILSIGGFLIYYVNTPAVLAQRMYEIKAKEDCSNPGLYYQEIYEDVANGEQSNAKKKISLAESDLKIHLRAAAILEPLLNGQSIFVHFVDGGAKIHEALVLFRYKDNDVIYKAYFHSDGSVFVTDSDLVTSLFEARRYQHSKKVKWNQIR